MTWTYTTGLDVIALNALSTYLQALLDNEVRLSTMIWGPSGIGKSSIVAQVAKSRDLGFIDLRLSQLAPTDLRGLPVAEAGTSKWFPPEFLPREAVHGARGILFLDELNLAPPTMQGMAQQLVLDRKVGSYIVPEGWFIWAAGNRKEDRASVFEMPAPLANRFLHLEVENSWESWKDHAIASGVAEQIIAFLAFRPELLHKMDAQRPAWPSPRSWVMASRLYGAKLSIAPVVGEGAAQEFDSYIELYRILPDLEPILEGRGEGIKFPDEPLARYATAIGLTVRAREPERGYNSFKWLVERAPAEWLQLFAVDLFKQMRTLGKMGTFAGYITKDDKLRGFLADYQKLMAP